MEIRTHKSVDPDLIGRPISQRDDYEAIVELEASGEMAVDEKGLIHGGFTFGLADYAAMLAVNHPHVVLAGSEARFLAPVKIGDVMKARAEIVERLGRRRSVRVDVHVGNKKVLSGTMNCIILDEHVLEL